MIACSSQEGVFFMRYESPNLIELEKDISSQFNELKQTHDDYDHFVKSVDLSENLTIARREKEAILLLKPYIENESFKSEDEDLAWLYLNYATAHQYDKNLKTAELFFKKALRITEEKNIESVKHYILHHYARLLVEKEEYELAREYFKGALFIRQQLNDKRIISTQKAIDTLNVIIERKK